MLLKYELLRVSARRQFASSRRQFASARRQFAGARRQFASARRQFASARRQFASARRQIETGLIVSFKPLSISLLVCLGTPFEFVFILDDGIFFSETTITDKK